jgi:FeS assembly protein SufD
MPNVAYINSLQTDLSDRRESQVLAEDCIKKNGLPSKASEKWRLHRNVLPHFYEKKPYTTFNEQAYPFDAYRVSFGITQDVLNALPFDVFSLNTLKHDAPSLYERYQARLIDAMNEGRLDGFIHLNIRDATDGFYVVIPENVTIGKPIILDNTIVEGMHSYYSTYFIDMQPHSKAVILENNESKLTKPYYRNHVTWVQASEGCELSHLLLQQEAPYATAMHHSIVNQHTKSHYDAMVIQLGSELSRVEMTIQLMGSKANAHCLGIMLTDKHDVADFRVSVRHMASDASSEQVFKGIANGESVGVFNGEIEVVKNASKSVAHQLSKQLLLSKGAKVFTQPVLKIDHDDVICSHGSSIGQLDENAFFYLVSRGIHPDEAKKILIQGFFQTNLMDALLDDKLSAYVLSVINTKMEAML